MSSKDPEPIHVSGADEEEKLLSVTPLVRTVRMAGSTPDQRLENFLCSPSNKDQDSDDGDGCNEALSSWGDPPLVPFSPHRPSLIHCKVLVLGATNAGKSSLIERFITGQFSVPQVTLGSNLYTKSLSASTSVELKAEHSHMGIKESGEPDGGSVVQDRRVTLVIHDLAGFDKFKESHTSYYRDVFALVCVFDVTSRKSIEASLDWLHHFSQHTNSMPSISVLVGNKCDQVASKWILDQETISEMAKEAKFDGFYLTSSADGTNVEELFKFIAAKFHSQLNVRQT